ncbi:Cytosolic carboxypeptidase 2 [Homalodisca vitripennis]|nr:Cytosolic carboxypeptidase 2 [Homalodisca vitripennis]
MMKGFMDFLTGDTHQARELREKFIFKLVPMLNPDGVIVGNNRCSLTGRDLNRQYRTVIRETYPPVWHTKLMIRRLMEECGIAMYCDLHAHSRKHNVFIYGCENKRYADKRLHEQVFPLMLHKNAADKFSFENCKFRIQRSKEGTGRVVVWMMGVANSYTMEASFGGSTLGGRNETHFTTQDYEAMGRSFCETLLDFCDEDPSKKCDPRSVCEPRLSIGSTRKDQVLTNLRILSCPTIQVMKVTRAVAVMMTRRQEWGWTETAASPPVCLLPHQSCLTTGLQSRTVNTLWMVPN